MNKKLLLLIPILLFSACQSNGETSSSEEESKKEGTFTLEIENAQTEYTIRDEFEPSSQMKVFAIGENGEKRQLDNKEYRIDSSEFLSERVGTYPITIYADDLNASIKYEVNVNVLKSFSILMIGNSHTDDTIQWAHEIANNLGLENVEIADLYYGGSGMDIHLDNIMNNKKAYAFRQYRNGVWYTKEGTSIPEAIMSKEEGWDYICLQEKAWYGAIDYEWDILDTYFELVEHYAHPRTRYCWNLTWAHNNAYTSADKTLDEVFNGDQVAMYNAEQSGVMRNIVGREEFDFIIDGGTAVQNARSSYLTDKRISRDYTHLSYDLGRFIVGLNLIKTISDVDLTNISWRPNGISDVEMAIAVESVENCAIDKFHITQSMYKVEP